MLNKVQLIGFLGADPELRRSNDSDAIARANIATSESWKKASSTSTQAKSMQAIWMKFSKKDQ